MATLTEERLLTCRRCGKTVTVVGGDWIDADLYECPTCRSSDTPSQASLIADTQTETVRDDWHGRYDPWMAEIPF